MFRFMRSAIWLNLKRCFWNCLPFWSVSKASQKKSDVSHLMSLRSQRKATALCVASMGLGIGRFKEWNPVSGIHWTSPPCDTLHILPVATLSPSWSFKWSLKLFRPASHFTPLTNRLLQIPDPCQKNFDSHNFRKENNWSIEREELF